MNGESFEGTLEQKQESSRYETEAGLEDEKAKASGSSCTSADDTISTHNPGALALISTPPYSDNSHNSYSMCAQR